MQEIVRAFYICTLLELYLKNYLADEVSFKLKQIVQDAAKFMHYSKRTKLVLSDIDNSLKIRNIKPQYHFVTPDSIPFRFASGSERELNFMEEKEINLSEVIEGGSPNYPLMCSCEHIGCLLMVSSQQYPKIPHFYKRKSKHRIPLTQLRSLRRIVLKIQLVNRRLIKHTN